MKKITKISISVLLIATVVGACFALVACNDDSSNLVAVAATDLLQEDFGIAVTKGNTSLMSAVNQVVDDWLANGKMNQYMNYYSFSNDSISELTAFKNNFNLSSFRK